MEISGRTVLLTGASGGIGRAMAQRLADAGARLLLGARDAERLASLAAGLAPGALTVAADIATASGRLALVEAARAAAVDVVIHNAGIQEFGLFDEQDPEALQRQLELNLSAPMLLTRELLPLLQQRNEAALVFVGSTFGSIGYPGFATYCASKFGLRGFAETLRRELSDSGVHVHYLAPRATRTELNAPLVVALNAALGTAMDEPSVVAGELLALLARARGSERFVGWPEKLFVRINGVLPRLVDAALAGKLSTVRRFARQNIPARRNQP
jgi:short-subunit dehydrogenase